ncbi:MAG: hypothetical protein JOY71_21455, partial [Acetobacteraceae bacterium]|nr:hypothetical protein [Acetobacteraceae bacterium]
MPARYDQRTARIPSVRLFRGYPRAATALVLLLVPPPPTAAATLEVGPGKPYPQPSAAAAVAHDGDRVVIAPGEYFDCAVWEQNNLVIEGDPAGGTVITDKTCQGKALFVIPGNDVTVRNLTLTRARVPDTNGAGIRAEGRNLTADRVRFINNQDGILAGGPPQSTLQIEHCTFSANGEPDPQLPTAALFVGELDHLSIHDTEFQPGRGGAVISSDTKVTEIINSHIARPESPRGTPVQVSGGLVAEDSTFQAGPVPGGKQAAILVVPGSVPDPLLILKRNRLEGSG